MPNEQNDPIKLNKLDTYRQIKNAKRFKIFLIVLLAIMIPLMIWGMFELMKEDGGYKIRVGPGSEFRLSLSFDKDFKDGGHSVLDCSVNHTSNNEGGNYDDIEKEIEDLISGKTAVDIGQGGNNAVTRGSDQYMVNKFYLRSTELPGGQALKYAFRIYIDDIENNALAAARIYVMTDIDNPAYTIHDIMAQPRPDGTAEYLATEGKGSDTYVKDPKTGEDWVCQNLKQNDEGVWYYESDISFLQPSDACGYCVAVWYEGSDPDHNDSIIGGAFTYTMEFVIIED